MLLYEDECQSSSTSILADAFDLAERVGRLGSPLSAADAAAVILKPLRPYSVGELCAARDPTLAASSAAAAAQERAGQTASTGIFAKVNCCK